MENTSGYNVGPPTNLDFEKSLMFFHSYMYGPLQGKLRLYNERGVRPGAVAMSSDWEVFASMIVQDVGTKLGAGIDLAGHEVKSAGPGAAYEYQYHRKTGAAKVAKDAQVGHLFFEYSDNLRRVDLRYVHGSQMREFFDAWARELATAYAGDRQRFRKNVPYKWVKQHGVLLMTLENGEVTYPVTAPAPRLTPLAAESQEPYGNRRRRGR